MASRTARLSGWEKARKADATRATAAPRRRKPPPSIRIEKRQGMPASARPSISSAKGREARGPRVMSRAP